MAQLDRETVAHLTKLSRIACTDDEVDDLLIKLKNILSYIDLLDEVDVEGVAPVTSVLADHVNVTREDVPGATLPRATFLANAPDHVAGMVRVPTIMKSK